MRCSGRWSVSGKSSCINPSSISSLPPTRLYAWHQVLVDGTGALGDVGPVEGEDVLGFLRDEPVAQLLVDEQPFDYDAEVLGVAAVEAQADALPGGNDLAQAAGVGDDAGTAGGHRLEGYEPERLVQRGHHTEVGDAVERVQGVVSYPTKKDTVVAQPETLGLGLELALVCARAGDQEAHARNLVDHLGQGIERELEALLIYEASHEQHQLLLGLGELEPQRVEVVHRAQVGGIDAVGDDGNATLVETVDVGGVTAHVVRAGDHRVGAVGHPALDRMDVGLRRFVDPALVASVLGGMD